MSFGFIKMDFFRKIPKDLTEPTFCGAFVSVVCTLLIGILCLTELKAYFSYEIKSTMLVDISHNDD